MLIPYLLLNRTNFFEKAQEFIELEKIFKHNNLFEYLLFIVEVFYPVFSIIRSLRKCKIDIPIFLSMYQIFNTLKKYIRYLELYFEINTWKTLVNIEYDGPFISTNDITYQSYVYAHTMQRSYDLLLTKKRAKSL